MSTIVPRDYQLEAVEETMHWFRDHKNPNENPLIGLPTGTGKSVVIALLLQWIFKRPAECRVMVLAHVKELIEQNSEELIGMWPGAPVGIHAAAMKQKDTRSKIIFGMVQSVASTLKRAKEPNPFGFINLLIVDEAHTIPPEDETTYQFVLSALRLANPKLRVIGLTATTYRQKQGRLTDGPLFTAMSYDRTTLAGFNWFVDRGYLAPLIPRTTSTEIDVSKVGTIAGEFNLKELEAVTNVERITIGAVREMLELGGDRERWLVFGAGIAHVESIGEILEAHGVSAVIVHSKRTQSANDEAIASFRAGKVRALVNANKLTTGFNVKEIDLIAMLRATRSVVLHVQMLGRGTRMSPGKKNCLVLDFAGNVKRLGPINDPTIPRKAGEKTGEPPPVKECQNCHTLNHTTARLCIACEFEFEFKTQLKENASSDVVIAGIVPKIKQRIAVTAVTYRNHQGASGNTLRVTYLAGSHSASEFVALESVKPWGVKLARRWWADRSPESVPATVAEALTKTKMLRTPKFITLLIGGKYPELISQE